MRAMPRKCGNDTGPLHVRAALRNCRSWERSVHLTDGCESAGHVVGMCCRRRRPSETSGDVIMESDQYQEKGLALKGNLSPAWLREVRPHRSAMGGHRDDDVGRVLHMKQGRRTMIVRRERRRRIRT
ncbi:uncharacterized protein [Phyllobates terribilis]|uniref:uncharacterized protein isoform X3 n=1 Tax=Phyllobates terribilis TaxID=111132 RepID=UPI003CCAC8F8